MNEEGKFWVAIWRTIAAGMVGLAAVIAGCSAHNTAAMKSIAESMARGGANPIDIKCAIGRYREESVCAIRAMKQ